MKLIPEATYKIEYFQVYLSRGVIERARRTGGHWELFNGDGDLWEPLSEEQTCKYEKVYWAMEKNHSVKVPHSH